MSGGSITVLLKLLVLTAIAPTTVKCGDGTNTAVWDMQGEFKTLCIENTKILVEKITATYTCSVQYGVEASNMSIYAIAVKIAKLEGHNTLGERGATVFGYIYKNHYYFLKRVWLGDVAEGKVQQYITESLVSLKEFFDGSKHKSDEKPVPLQQIAVKTTPKLLGRVGNDYSDDQDYRSDGDEDYSGVDAGRDDQENDRNIHKRQLTTSPSKTTPGTMSATAFTWTRGTCTPEKSEVIKVTESSFTLNNPSFFKEAAQKQFKQGYGVNTVLFGCPQPLCLDSNVDAVIPSNDTQSKDFYAYRGAYVWDIKESSDQKEARYLQEFSLPGGNTKPNFIESGYFSDNKFKLILFGYTYESEKFNGQFKIVGDVGFIKPDDKLKNVEATFVFSNRLYIVRDCGAAKCMESTPIGPGSDQRDSGTNTSTVITPKKHKQRAAESSGGTITNTELSGSLISAMFVLSGQLYVLKGWKYAKVEADAFIRGKGNVPLEWRFSFLEVFRCDTMKYQLWGKDLGFKYYKDFLDQYYERDSTKPGTVDMICFVDVLIIIIIEVLVVIASFIYWKKYRKESEMGLLSMVKAGRKGHNQRFTRIAMAKSKIQENKGSQLDVRRSKMSQLDVLDLPESMIGGTKKNQSALDAPGSKVSSKIASKKSPAKGKKGKKK